MEVYERVAKVVAPKKAKLAEAEGELVIQLAKLNEKRAELKTILGEKHYGHGEYNNYYTDRFLRQTPKVER